MNCDTLYTLNKMNEMRKKKTENKETEYVKCSWCYMDGWVWHYLFLVFVVEIVLGLVSSLDVNKS